MSPPSVFSVIDRRCRIYNIGKLEEKPALTFLQVLKIFRLPLWSSGQEFLAAYPEVLGSIPGATRFS
jgi:hypothetical protein